MSAPAAVIDASVWVSNFTPSDVHHAASRRWLERYVAGGGQVIAPALLLAEVAGAIARPTGDSALGLAALNSIIALPALRVVPLDQGLSADAARLAATLRLRGADAVYVATAAALNVPLITWDREQLSRTAGHITALTP